MCEVKEYINIQTGERLDLEKVNTLPDNAMLKVRPDLWNEWNFEKNDELDFNIWKMTKGRVKKTWWLCDKCDSAYDASVPNKIRNRMCSYCAGQKVNHTNSLATLNPELASEWHPTLNGDLTPNEVTCGSNQKVWWIGTCGHEWEAPLKKRAIAMEDCPYCNGKKRTLKGFNDMWTTNPKLASLLANPEDGYKYRFGSKELVDWRCINCDIIIKNKRISDIRRQGLPCPICSDGISYPEKFIFNFLKQLNIDFIKEASNKDLLWTENKRYDFYIPSLSMIIETHGKQHTERTGFEKMGGRSLEEEIENDKYKREIALQNGIINYIELDCRKSNTEYIRNSIMNSEMVNLFDLSKVDWKHIALQSEKALIYDICDNWNEGMSVGEIANKIMLCIPTVTKYLIRGNGISICNYSKDESKIRGARSTIKKNSKKVVQLSLNDEYINVHTSVSNANFELTNKKSGIISSACSGKYKTAYGFKWMYKKDYEKYIEEQNKLDLQCGISSF